MLIRKQCKRVQKVQKWTDAVSDILAGLKIKVLCNDDDQEERSDFIVQILLLRWETHAQRAQPKGLTAFHYTQPYI